MAWDDAFGFDAFAFDGDGTIPVVRDYSPPVGTKIGRSQPLSFSVTDDSGAFSMLVISVAFSLGVAETAHDGNAFLVPYQQSVRITIAGGYRYTLRRVGGWPAAPTVKTIVVDAAGNSAG